MNESKGPFEQQLSNETLSSERLRASILAGLFTLMAFAFFVLYTFFQDEYLRIFDSHLPVYAILIFLGGVIAYETIIMLVLGYRIRKRKAIPELLRYWNAFLETSTPSVLILIVAGTINPLYALNSPPIFAYFLFIILSTLRLDFKLSIFTGLVAAGEYIAIAFCFLGQHSDPIMAPPFGTRVYYLGKGMLLLAAGIAAGAITIQIQKGILNSFKTMEERNKVINLFGQQVSQEIVDELLKQKAGLASQKRFVCIMFLDLRNFTPFAEQKKPEEVVAYQNAVFGFMIETINRHHGLINQFLGDGFMATFGAPISHGNDCRNAVEAALEIIARVKQESEAGNIPPTRVGIGLHAGEAVTGNIGTALRQQYSITGNVVILASRIEQLNKQFQSQVLISQEVWQAMDKDINNAIALGAVHVKGRHQPIFLYKLAA